MIPSVLINMALLTEFHLFAASLCRSAPASMILSSHDSVCPDLGSGYAWLGFRTSAFLGIRPSDFGIEFAFTTASNQAPGACSGRHLTRGVVIGDCGYGHRFPRVGLKLASAWRQS